MKQLSLTILIFLFVFGASASIPHSPRKIYELAIKADKIVFGTIQSIGFQRVTLKIEGSLTGETDSITFNKVTHRWTEYKVGQRVLLFLEYWDRQLEVMSSGHEGEYPITDDSIYINFATLPSFLSNSNSEELVKSKVGNYEIFGAKYRSMRMTFTEFIQTVQHLRNCYNFEYGQYNSIIKTKITCPTESFGSSSELLMNWIIDVLSGKDER
ncbi:MAG: hypothetical protein RIC80_13430 [Cyclobacteriaceae bacterium]